MHSCFIFRAPTVRFISKTKSTPYEVLINMKRREHHETLATLV